MKLLLISVLALLFFGCGDDEPRPELECLAINVVDSLYVKNDLNAAVYLSYEARIGKMRFSRGVFTGCYIDVIDLTTPPIDPLTEYSVRGPYQQIQVLRAYARTDFQNTFALSIDPQIGHASAIHIRADSTIVGLN